VIVLDTTVLVYAVGEKHPLREPSRMLVEAITDGRVRATTSVEVVQEFAHVRAQRRERRNAVSLARFFAELLSPLLSVTGSDLERGLQLFQRHERVGAFDALLAAAAIRAGAESFVSGDTAFGEISALPFVALGSPELDTLLP
jgi:predicted nucleic acid-binding protein